jgi:transcriptional regulator with XRE-family HTH domain
MTAKLEDEQAMIIARNISRLISEYKMTQAELGKVVGVSESAVGKWLLGYNAPSMGSIQKIADYFHVNKSDILEDRDIIKSQKRKYLMDRIAKASDEQLRKLDKLWEIITEEDERNH